jgi:hypothetical protein
MQVMRSSCDSLRRFFVKPETPNSAARWPYLRGLAAATDKYEERPHDVVEVNNGVGDPPPSFGTFSQCETEYRNLDVPANSAKLHP